MPPKKSKTLKAVEAEIKKKNTEKAKAIVAMLKQKAIVVQDVASSSKTARVVNSAAIGSTSNEISYLEVADTDHSIVDLTKTDTSAVVDFEMTPPKNVVSNATRSLERSGASCEVIQDLKRKSCTTSASKNVDCTVKTCKTSNKASSAAIASLPSKKLKPPKEFNYEIDCSRVSDSINAKDLQKYLQKQIKVNGKKSDLGDNAGVLCQGQKVSISSKIFLPKRYLRFLSKKFLKKKGNVRVVGKDKHSYEFKYVGTQ